jgi:hypothetical protein
LAKQVSVIAAIQLFDEDNSEAFDTFMVHTKDCGTPHGLTLWGFMMFQKVVLEKL